MVSVAAQETPLGLYDKEFARIRRELGEHEAKARRSRSFDFRKPGTSHFAYSLTWTAGSLSLVGDCGEVSVVHVHALWDLKDGLKWAAQSDYDYLLGKTSLRQSYCADATTAFIIEQMIEQAKDSLKYHHKDVRGWRRDRPDVYRWSEYDWDLPEEGDEERWLEDRPVLKCEPKNRFAKAENRWWEKDYDLFEAPDGWDLWLQVWREYDLSSDPNMIFTSKGRQRLKAYVEECCYSRDGAIRLCQQIGLDDYYGSERWTFHDLLRVECVRKGAADALQVLQHEEFEAAPYSWTEKDFWGSSLPPRTAFVDWLATAFVRECGLPSGFLFGPDVSLWHEGWATKAAERILSEALDAASSGYNQTHNFVHVPGRYGLTKLDWTPEGAARMVADWVADSNLFWATDAESLPEDFDYGVEPLVEEVPA